MTRSADFDVVIAGAGVAGCATAIALQRFVPGLKVCLIDREAADSDNYQQHIRPRIGETLPPAVAIPMQQLGIWPRFKAMQALASTGTQSVWGATQPHVNEHIYSPHGNGWHLNRRRFDALLRDTALKAGTQLISHAHVADIQSEHQQWRLTVRGNDETDSVTARLVVDATGRRSGIARRLGVDHQKHDRLIGIYRFYSPCDNASVSTDSSTVIESHANGYWYAARLPNQQQVVALMTDADLARRGDFADSDSFQQALAKTALVFQRTVGMHADSEPVITAAHTQCLDTLSGPGWLAVGDAAFTYDPLSSLGIFKALRQSILAAYAIKDVDNGKDPELLKYRHVCRAEFARYLDKRREVYAQESRFSDNPFWHRRLAA